MAMSRQNQSVAVFYRGPGHVLEASRGWSGTGQSRGKCSLSAFRQGWLGRSRGCVLTLGCSPGAGFWLRKMSCTEFVQQRARSTKPRLCGSGCGRFSAWVWGREGKKSAFVEHTAKSRLQLVVNCKSNWRVLRTHLNIQKIRACEKQYEPACCLFLSSLRKDLFPSV